jgi:hypothetical protein
MRICKYRNCRSEVKGRPNKLYCKKNLEKSNLPNRAPIDNITQGPTGSRGMPGPTGMTINEYRSFKLKKIFKKL